MGVVYRYIYRIIVLYGNGGSFMGEIVKRICIG